MRVAFGVGCLLVASAAAAPAWAGIHVAPEIDPGMATSALALLTGGVLLLIGRARRK